MDPSLIRQQEAFKKRALAQPVVEKRKQPKIEDGSISNGQAKKKSKKLTRPTGSSSNSSSSYERSFGTSSKFGVLAQIVNFMRVRHQDDDLFPLTIDEILEECKLDETLPISQKNWLHNEALMHNPKIQVIEDPTQERKFVFKPKYNIRDKKALLKHLDRHDQRGLGGIMLADVEESLPNAKKCLRQLGNKIIFVTRPDKKQILFYNDKSCEYTVDEEFQKLWRSIPVDSVDETKIEEYLNQHGISSVQGEKVKPIQKRKRATNRKRKFKTHNHHLNGVLEDYSEKQK